jgi:hypothetical protein
MKKTALQQLIDRLNSLKEDCTDEFGNVHSQAIVVYGVAIDQATELLETEREQIEEAYDAGFGKFNSSEQYYKDTYK